MQELGPCLKNIMSKTKKNRLCIKSVIMIGLQYLDRLESLHKADLVHKDLKPGNTLIGKSPTEQKMIFLIDFGLTRPEDKEDQMFLVEDDGLSVIGTCLFASANCHSINCCYKKKDDLESMMYILAFLATGTLPWLEISK